ncbi:putative xyloglucan glycosyltransferase 5 [Dorcoceras hygrometricum]|uniref:Putative xyloglucan glycosyltransferase 5 n=1 Tax=Dorcoceras hygrometricum TaxID=472368 RepID=A0A2Z7CYF5_9LAMI|nr:putative xyloglucan glycosyltransferase 5 [Dorcoceras hygrometricum]
MDQVNKQAHNGAEQVNQIRKRKPDQGTAAARCFSPWVTKSELINCVLADDKNGSLNRPSKQASTQWSRAACLDWSRHEDIKTGTMRGRLSWTDRRYLAGTVSGCPSWFSSLLPECREHQTGSPAWSRSSTKIKRRVFRRAEFKCREMKCKTVQEQIKCSVQEKCSSAEPYKRAVIKCTSDH